MRVCLKIKVFSYFSLCQGPKAFYTGPISRKFGFNSLIKACVHFKTHIRIPGSLTVFLKHLPILSISIELHIGITLSKHKNLVLFVQICGAQFHFNDFPHSFIQFFTRNGYCTVILLRIFIISLSEGNL